MPTPNEWQQLILLEVGAGLEGEDPAERQLLDKVTPNINTIWACHADKAYVAPKLQYLYTKRHCIEIIMGQLRDLVQSNVGGYNSQQQQKLANLKILRDNTQQEIVEEEKRAQSARPPAIGYLTQQAPRQPIPLGAQPDPGDPAYRGDPYRHRPDKI
jgi:hypothetical protein